MRSIAPRWLVAVAIAGAATLLIPGLAAAETAVLETPASAQPTAPAGEVVPAADPLGTTDPLAPVDGAPAAGDEITAPVDEAPVAAPAPPPAATPEEAAAPVPGTEATPTPAPAPGEVIQLPAAQQPLPNDPDVPLSPGALPPLDRVAAAVATPTVSLPPTAPDQPGSPAVAAKPDAPAAAPEPPRGETIPDFVTTILAQGDVARAEISAVAAASAAATAANIRFGDDDSGDGAGAAFAPRFVAPIGTAPTGSSLLAVLAGYVLPGSGGAPASTIVLFIVLGLILGLTYGAFPQMTERLALGNLMGASRGHGLAVRRPG